MNARALANAICPGIRHAQVRYKDLLQQLLKPEVRWLDLGCGHEVVRPWTLSPGENQLSLSSVPTLSIGIDSDQPSLQKNASMPYRVVGNVATLPFRAASFDLATANMVLEHVQDPAAVLAEVGRVLRPDGIFMFLTPNRYYPPLIMARLVPASIKPRLVALIERRDESDVYPTFYRMNSLATIRGHAEAAGFAVTSSELLETLTYSPSRVVFSLNLALAWLLRRSLFRRFQADFLVTAQRL